MMISALGFLCYFSFLVTISIFTAFIFVYFHICLFITIRDLIVGLLTNKKLPKFGLYLEHARIKCYSSHTSFLLHANIIILA